MSLLHLPDSIASQNLQIWNNAAFDDAGAGAAGDGVLPLRPLSTNLPAGSSEIDPSKENRSPGFLASPLSKKAPSPAPLRPSVTKPASKKPSRVVAFKEETKVHDDEKDHWNVDDEIERVKKQISQLTSRLEALQINKAETDFKASAAGKRGRVVPAKFMDTKQGAARTPTRPASKKTEESPASPRIRRRGLSLGPLEIIASPAKVLDPKRSLMKNLESSALRKIEKTPASGKVRRRGISLGPLEIHEGSRLGQIDKPNATVIRTAQSCKKSSSRKLQGIEESKGVRKEMGMSCSPKSRSSLVAKTTSIGAKKVTEVSANSRISRRGLSLGPCEIAMSAKPLQPKKLQEIKEKGAKVEKKIGSSSASPKPRRNSSAKVSDMRKGIATVGAKKPVKRDDQSLPSIKPKALFHDRVKPAESKRPKSAKSRVVASRYSLAPSRAAAGDEPESKRRKWSLPELESNENDEYLGKPSGSTPECKRSQESEVQDQVEAEKGISGDFDNQGSNSSSAEKCPSITKFASVLPKIRIFRCDAETPRDSGCAKRVSQLVGRKSLFAAGEDEELNSPCQVLAFQDEE